MLLAIDIGNSSTKFGLFGPGGLIAAARTKHDRGKGAPKLPAGILKASVRPDQAIISSVVPGYEAEYGELLSEEFGITAEAVDHSLDFGIDVRYHPPEDCGLDRLLAAAAAVELHGTPCVVCDFGTATTIDAVDETGTFLGGTISPGIGVLAESLHGKTARLPLVVIGEPPGVIGDSTANSIRSGIFYGYTSLVDGLVVRISKVLGENVKVVATGGHAGLIAPASEHIRTIEPNLVLEGLSIVHRRNFN